MKQVVYVVMVGVMAATFGCSKSTSGGPGASLPKDKQSTIGMTADTFSLDTPMMSTKLAQGETKGFTIGIKRGKDIDQDVTLQFDEMPKGVTIDPTHPVIKKSAMDAKMSVVAADDASLGDFTVKVSGHPATGPDATSDLKITINKK